MVTAFEQFAGNTKTVEEVKNLLITGRLPQAMVIEGPVGSGRTTLALLMAAALMCDSPLPCSGCDACRKVFELAHPDITMVRPPKDKSAILVDQIRWVRSQAVILPGEAACKVFVLSGLMNDAAQNAFLTLLEEPPKGVYFILIGEHRHQYIETVRSRVAVFSLHPITYEQALPVLRHNQYPIDHTTPLAFEQAGGLLGGLLAGSDQLHTAKEIALAAGNALANNSRVDLLLALAPAADNRGLFAPVLQELYVLLHGALAAMAHPQEDNPTKTLLARRFTKKRLAEMASLVATLQKDLVYNPNGGLFFTRLCAKLLP